MMMMLYEKLFLGQRLYFTPNVQAATAMVVVMVSERKAFNDKTKNKLYFSSLALLRDFKISPLLLLRPASLNLNT
jgi:hypothetical protein